MNKLKPEGVGGTGREKPKNIYAYTRSPWAQTTMWCSGGEGLVERDKVGWRSSVTVSIIF